MASRTSAWRNENTSDSVSTSKSAFDEMTQDRDQFLVGVRGNGGEQVEVDPRDTEHRGRLQHAPLLGGQVVELCAHELGQAPRELLDATASRDRRRGRAEQLLEKERVAARARMQRVDDPVRRPAPVDRGEKRPDLSRRQAFEVQMRDRVPPFEAREHLRGRVATVQRVGAIRADEQPRTTALLRQALEQRDALVVGPVQVVEHDEARRGRGEVVHDLEAEAHPFVGADGSGRRGASSRSSSRPGPSERVEQQFEGTAERARIGLAREHDRVRREAVDQLAHQPGLADAGFAAYERDRGPGRIDESCESLQLVGPAGHL